MDDNIKRYALAICSICDNTSDSRKLFHTSSNGDILVNYLYDKIRENGLYFDSNDKLKAFNEEVSELAKELYARKYAEKEY